MIDAKDLEIKAKGRWHGIFTSIGIPESYLTGKHGPCIICKGRDRWRWDNKDGSGSFFCNQCQPKSGSGITLVQKYLGCSFPEALEKIQSIIGGCEVQTLKPDQNIEQKKANLNKLWQASTDLTGSCPVSKYFHGRGLNLTPSHIRYCPVCYEPDTGKEYPAIIAKILNFEGKPVGLQRIYLTDENIGSKKKLMPNTENLNGAAIRLFEPANELFDTKIIGIAEGICTAMAAAQMHGVAVWSCISNILMESWMPPVGIRHIIVFSDNDSSFAGQKSAYILANKLYSKDFIVEVVVPDQIGQDFNDVLKSS